MPVFKKIPRWVLRMCGMDFFILVRFRFGFRKKTRIRFRMSLVASVKKRGSVWILQLFTTHVIANITATVDDMTLTSLTTTTTSK